MSSRTSHPNWWEKMTARAGRRFLCCTNRSPISRLAEPLVPLEDLEGHGRLDRSRRTADFDPLGQGSLDSRKWRHAMTRQRMTKLRPSTIGWRHRSSGAGKSAPSGGRASAHTHLRGVESAHSVSNPVTTGRPRTVATRLIVDPARVIQNILMSARRRRLADRTGPTETPAPVNSF